SAARLLMVPDLLAYFLTGESRFERTNASTTQLVDVRTGEVVDWLARALGLRPELFAPSIDPGEMLGPALAAVASHDTASAVLGVPATVDDFAYVVSGTWSLVGFELDRPVIDEASRHAN